MPEQLFKVIYVEASTGIILDVQKNYQQGPFDSSCYVFQSYDDALSFAKEITKQSPEIECCIFNEANNFFHSEQSLVPFEKKPIKKKNWWYFF